MRVLSYRQAFAEQDISRREYTRYALVTRRKLLEHTSSIPYLNHMDFPVRGYFTGSRVQVPLGHSNSPYAPISGHAETSPEPRLPSAPSGHVSAGSGGHGRR